MTPAVVRILIVDDGNVIRLTVERAGKPNASELCTSLAGALIRAYEIANDLGGKGRK